MRIATEHPHVCGEKKSIEVITDGDSGTSPRVWGKEILS